LPLHVSVFNLLSFLMKRVKLTLPAGYFGAVFCGCPRWRFLWSPPKSPPFCPAPILPYETILLPVAFFDLAVVGFGFSLILLTPCPIANRCFSSCLSVFAHCLSNLPPLCIRFVDGSFPQLRMESVSSPYVSKSNC